MASALAGSTRRLKCPAIGNSANSIERPSTVLCQIMGCAATCLWRTDLRLENRSAILTLSFGIKEHRIADLGFDYAAIGHREEHMLTHLRQAAQ